MGILSCSVEDGELVSATAGSLPVLRDNSICREGIPRLVSIDTGDDSKSSSAAAFVLLAAFCISSTVIRISGSETRLPRRIRCIFGILAADTAKLALFLIKRVKLASFAASFGACLRSEEVFGSVQ